MSNATQNIFIYGPGGEDRGYPAGGDAHLISMGGASKSDPNSQETNHPEIGNLGEAMLAAMNKEPMK